VARALHDPRYLALPRLPGVVLGLLSGDVLGLVDLFRNARPVLRPVSAGHSSVPGDLDLRDQGGAAPQAGGGSPCLSGRASTACWRSSTARKRWWRRQNARATRATASSTHLHRFPSKNLRTFCSLRTHACSASVCTAAFSVSRSLWRCSPI